MNKSLTSELISFVRFPLAVCVVMVHCYYRITGWQPDKLSEQGIGSNVVMEFLLSNRIFVLFAVSFFFLVSGYLFFIHLEEWDWGIWREKMTRRIWTLLVPYLFWNSLFILYTIGPEVWRSIAHGNSWEIVKTWINDNGGWFGLYWDAKVIGAGQVDLWGHPSYTTTPILLPFFFIRNLIILNLFAPLYHFLLRSRNNQFSPYAMVSMVVLAFLYFTQTSFLIPEFTAEAFFFFGGGAFLSLNQLELSEVFYAKRWPIALITICLFGVMLSSGYLYSRTGRTVYPFFVVFEVMAAVNVAAWVVRRSRTSSLWSKLKTGIIKWQDATFLIFALHYFFLNDVFKMLNKVGGALTGYYDVRKMEMADRFPYICILNYLLRVVIVVAICMMAYRLLHRFLPRFCKILCGR